MSFGENVRWRRKALGLTQLQVAQAIRVHHKKVTPSYISRIEHGSIDPQLSTIRSLARVLQVKPWYLLAALMENTDFWDGYLQLPSVEKREVQRDIYWRLRVKRYKDE